MVGRLGIGVASSNLLAGIVLVNERLISIEDGAVIVFCDFFEYGKCDGICDGVRLGLYSCFVLNGDGEHV